MYKNEFDKVLQNRLPKALLLYGEDSYAIEQYISFYIEKLGAKDEKLKLYFDEYNFDQAKNYLSQNSLFGGVNLLIIKTEKVLPKKEVEILLKLTAKSSDNYFCYIFLGIQKDIKPLTTLYRDANNVEVRLFEPSLRDAIATLRQKANHITLEIDNHALEYLVVNLNNNLLLASSELDKLKILNRAVTTKDIADLVFCETSMGAEKLVLDAINKKMSLSSLSSLLESGSDSATIVRTTQILLNQILLFQAYIKLNGTINSQDILGYKLPKQIEEQRASIANKIKSSKLLKAFEYVLKCDLEIKTAPAPQKETLLYAMFIELQNIL